MEIQIPVLDQVYQPSEEELRGHLHPYENVICTECHHGGDDALMLLCDLCDSPAHTYCVGLGREVPEGNWYCKCCRPAAFDPYENVMCTECHHGGDDALMLLCDLCDSPAHTYCVGLGREVPEGNWYCKCCRPAAFDPYENVMCTECHHGGDDALMLLCDLCDSPAHTYCVGLGREVPEGNWYCKCCRPAAFDPYENVMCTECHHGGDDALMLLCDLCDSPAHTYCVGLGREVPEGNWYCKCCRPAAFDPYENVMCTECHHGGDDALMLLFDLCDSPAHTYCVGLGREVPEGNWYCEGCKQTALDSSNPQGLNPTSDYRTTNNFSSGSSPITSVSFDLNEGYVPDTPLTQGTGQPSPRLFGADFQAYSPASGSSAFTLHERRRIQRQIPQIFSIRRQQDTGTNDAQPTILESSLFGSQVGWIQELGIQHVLALDGRITSHHIPYQG